MNLGWCAKQSAPSNLDRVFGKLTAFQLAVVAEMIRENAIDEFGSIDSKNTDDHIETAKVVENWLSLHHGYAILDGKTKKVTQIARKTTQISHQ